MAASYSTHPRSNFTGKVGFVLATAGSAVGLGNIWRFPYLAAKYGGGIFLLVYILLVISFGFALVLTETAIGRKTGKSAIEAFDMLSHKWRCIGWLHSIVPVLILPYYSVIGGWVTKYFVEFLLGHGAQTATGDYFTAYISQPASPVLWFLVFFGATYIVIMCGVEKGIEKVSKILMPLLVVLSIGIAAYSVTRPGAWEGVKYYLLPDFSKFSPNTLLAAMGQMFYSLSLSMGILITYGSYMRKDIAMDSSVRQVELFDTGIAVVAGLMIIPAVFAYSGGDQSALQAGPSLMFITLPKVFASMGIGTAVGIAFFLLVLFAALTSSISLMEAVVSIVNDKTSWGRGKSCAITAVVTILLGIPSSLGFGLWSGITPLGMSILDFFDFITNSILMPIAALGTCFFVAKVIGVKTIIDEVKVSSPFKGEKSFVICIKYLAPVCIAAILVSSVLQSLGVFSL